MNRIALITGGSTGIGRSTAVALAKSGHDIGITYASSEDEAATTSELVSREGRRCIIKQLDLSSPEQAIDIVDELVGDLGGVDTVVSNAGMMLRKQLCDIDFRSAQKIFNVNTLGATLFIQRCVHHMLPGGLSGPRRPRPGRIVVVTSVHEEIANPTDTLYTMTKHALGGLVKCLALDLSPLNITVNSVAPGEIATPMNDMEAEDFDDSERPAIPSRRSGHPDEVAAVIEFLSRESSGFVTGARWPIDGGFEAATPLAASAFRENYLENSPTS